MNKSDAVRHFGSQTAIARVLRISKQAVNAWPEIIPEGRAYKLQVITAGHLRVDPSAYVKHGFPSS